MSNHAPLAPSSASRLVVCAGSRAIAEAYPQEETIDTRNGHSTHWAAKELLTGQQVALGQVADNGVTLTDEMIEVATVYADAIFARDGIENVFGHGHVEEPVASGALHLDNYGTPDYWRWDAEAWHLYVDDLKNGHRYVSEVRNWQLMNYAALILKLLNMYGVDKVKITMTIHQPRAYHRRGPSRSWTVTLGELRKDLAALSYAFRAAMEPDAPGTANDPDECLDCPGRHVCEAAIAAGYAGVDMAYDSTPLVMSPAALSKEYRLLVRAEKAIKARREGIKQAVMSSIQRGVSVPYFMIEHTTGRRYFRDEAIEQGIIEVAQVYGVKVTKDDLITPIQAIKAGIPKDVVMMYSHAPSGAAELVEDDGTFAANIFKG